MVAKRILITAGETSGDIYTSTLIDKLLLRKPNLEIFAVGGVQTSKRPVKLLYDSSNWAAIGLVEAIKQFPRLIVVLKKLKAFLRKMRPDLLILVDYPGFNMRLVKEAYKLGIPTLYYFPPSKFATDPKDVADAAKHITLVAANFSFTYEVYKKAGANVKMVGHPLLDIAKPLYSKSEAIQRFGLDPNKTTIALCPGSRKSELTQMLPIMLQAAKLLHKKNDNLQFVIPVIYSNNDLIFGIPRHEIQNLINTINLPIKLIEGNIYDVMNISKLLLISSGTATLEAANIGTPMVIVYKVSFTTEIIARIFAKIPPYIGMPNIILNKPAIPELIQHNLTPQNLAHTAWNLLTCDSEYNQQKENLKKVISHLGKPGAHDKVVEMAMYLLGEIKSLNF